MSTVDYVHVKGSIIDFNRIYLIHHLSSKCRLVFSKTVKWMDTSVWCQSFMCPANLKLSTDHNSIFMVRHLQCHMWRRKRAFVATGIEFSNSKCTVWTSWSSSVADGAFGDTSSSSKPSSVQVLT